MGMVCLLVGIWLWSGGAVYLNVTGDPIPGYEQLHDPSAMPKNALLWKQCYADVNDVNQRGQCRSISIDFYVVKRYENSVLNI